MGLKALVRQWFEEWSQERTEGEFQSRVDARIKAWENEHLKQQLDAFFDGRFDERFNALPKADLKALLDAYFEARAEIFIAEQFDIRFFNRADEWADKNLKQRLDGHFDSRFSARLDTLVQARVANRIDDRIDRRIEQWLLTARTRLAGDAQPPTDDPTPPSPPSGPADIELAETLVTAHELVTLLGKANIGKRHVRTLLRGKEATRSGRTYRYRLGDAAALILLRTRRGRRRRADGNSGGQG